MRIKKPNNKTNQDITFDTIKDRNEAIKTLFDGDMVKVLDASNDPLIKSGWAVYRFCFENQSFDLIEQEVKDLKIDEFAALSGFKNEKLTVYDLPNMKVDRYNNRGIVSFSPFARRFDFFLGIARVGQCCEDKFDLLPDDGTGSLYLHIYIHSDTVSEKGRLIHRFENKLNLSEEISHAWNWWLLYAIVRYDYENFEFTGTSELPLYRNSYQSRQYPKVLEVKSWARILSKENQLGFSQENKWYNEGMGGAMFWLAQPDGRSFIVGTNGARDIEQMRHGATFSFPNDIILKFNHEDNIIRWNKNEQIIPFSYNKKNYNCKLLNYQNYR